MGPWVVGGGRGRGGYLDGRWEGGGRGGGVVGVEEGAGVGGGGGDLGFVWWSLLGEGRMGKDGWGRGEGEGEGEGWKVRGLLGKRRANMYVHTYQSIGH